MTAYTGTVTVPARPAFVAGLGLVLGALVWLVTPWWAALAVAVVTLPVTWTASAVRVAIGHGSIRLGEGLRRARTIPLADVVDASIRTLAWPQVFGVGIRSARRTTRLTVRPGPTLCLRLADGEVIRVSVADPVTALALLIPSKEDT